MNYHHTSTEKGARHAAVRQSSGRRLRAAALVGVVGSVVAVAAPAVAAPAKPVPHPSEDSAATRARIAALYRQADLLTQTYDAAVEQAGRLTIAVQRSQDQLQQSRVEYAKQQAQLGEIAAAQYRSGNLDKRLQLMLADHPDTFLASAAVVDRLSDEQLRKIAQVIDTQRQLVELQHDAAEQLGALAETRAQVVTARHDVAAQLHQAQALVNTLSTAQRRQVANADLGADPAEAADQTTRIPLAGLSDMHATGRARTAIQAAYATLGKPYVYGAEGPDAFDCSGLMQRVWRQAGVELPRTSSEQATAGHLVAPSEIQPGDLVIYYKARNHIGLYIGDGKIIHAPHPGSQVRISPLNSMPVNMVVRV